MKELQNLSVEDIQNIENVIGYTFKNKVLLEQAFTRSSFANEHKEAVSNEVLEFYGDRALDIVVTKAFSKAFGEFDSEGRYVAKDFEGKVEEVNEGFLSDLRSILVRKSNLARRIDELELAKYLLLGNSDKQNEQLSESIKEDLFESICGSMAFDSDWDFASIEPAICKMLELEDSLNNIGSRPFYEIIFAKWYFDRYHEYPKFYYELWDEYQGVWNCTLEFEHLRYDGRGNSKLEARNQAICSAYDELFDEGRRFEYFPDELDKYMKPSWLDPELDTAINIVQEMEQSGIIHDVNYTFEEVGNDENGNPLWECTATFNFGINHNCSCKCSRAKSKKEIKKRVALSIINCVFEETHVYVAHIKPVPED